MFGPVSSRMSCNIGRIPMDSAVSFAPMVEALQPNRERIAESLA
jgi:hypothetical protein